MTGDDREQPGAAGPGAQESGATARMAGDDLATMLGRAFQVARRRRRYRVAAAVLVVATLVLAVLLTR